MGELYSRSTDTAGELYSWTLESAKYPQKHLVRMRNSLAKFLAFQRAKVPAFKLQLFKFPEQENPRIFPRMTGAEEMAQIPGPDPPFPPPPSSNTIPPPLPLYLHWQLLLSGPECTGRFQTSHEHSSSVQVCLWQEHPADCFMPSRVGP